MNYTAGSTDIVFLKDSDIAVTIDGKTISGDSLSAASNVIPSFTLLSTTYQQLSTYDVNLSTYLSANVDLSVNNLCIDLSALSNSVSTEMAAIELSSHNISVVLSSLSTDLSNEITAINTDIDNIYTTIKGGVNYKGHITIKDIKVADRNQDLSNIFVNYFQGGNNTTLVPDFDYELSNGYLYSVTLSNNMSSYTTNDGIEFEPNDYIIIHSHDKDYVKVSELTRDTIDLIESVQDDYVRRYLLNDISTILTDDVHYLSGKIDDLAADDQYLSNEISTTVEVYDTLDGSILSTKTKLISVTNDQYKQLVKDGSLEQAALYIIEDSYTSMYGQRVADIALPINSNDAATKKYVDSISAELSDEIVNEHRELVEDLCATVNTKYVHLSGNETIKNNLTVDNVFQSNGPIVGKDDIITEKSLSVADVNHGLKINTTAITNTIVSTKGPTAKIDIYTYEYPERTGTIALIEDVNDLCASLSCTSDSNLESLSTHLSTEIQLLSSSISGDVDSLSNRLSVEIQTLSTSLSTDLSVLSGNVYEDLGLSVQNLTATLTTCDDVATRYNNTFLSEYDGKDDDIVDDNLILTDIDPMTGAPASSTHHQRYYMTFEHGTLVLNKIS